MVKDELTTQSIIVTNNGSITIKDVVVADPSIEFSISINPNVYRMSTDGIYFQNFGAQISISNLDPVNPTKLTNVGAIIVATMANTGAYFYFTFGDPRYVAGTKFTLCIVLTAFDPTSGEPINFTENPIKFEVFGGGIINGKS